ncbi:hypothetical protein E4U44_004273 [Claviceps purpurea]|nr:hypothetical protein E4U44_004273 [Claviceps purpurea]
MIGRLTFHHLVSLGSSILSLSLSHTHTHARTHIQTHLFSYRSNTSHRAIILLAIKKNEAHLSRASHFLCRHRRSSHASYR